MKNPAFIFENSQAAAHHNSLLLEKHNFDLEKIISSNHPSPLSFGSDFQPSSDLFELL
jgi:uracil DNA glycosylase